MLYNPLVFPIRFFWLLLFLEKIKTHLQTEFERLTLLAILMSLVCSPVLAQEAVYPGAVLETRTEHSWSCGGDDLTQVLADVESFVLQF